ncbi:MAG: TraB/GumN family protein [Novosphingobium sp.]|uniref:TraB/GumN family protein n=1 Tax=Novosphingobium sp. TaxID=1874826 RepID=UPI0032BC0530
MKLRSIFKGAALAAFALLGSATLAQQRLPTQQPIVAVPAPDQAKPALWKLADKDTTIYLFGTIHILPKGVDWFHGPVAYAFNHSDLLVTELPDVPQSEFVGSLARYGVLPAGQSLRDKLSEDRRGRYEGAMAGLDLPVESFDRSRPWVPAMLMPLLAVQKFGFEPGHGVEATLDAHAKEKTIPRIGLETLDFQFGLFSTQSEAEQIEFLDTVVKGIPEMKGLISQMVVKWSAGDAAELAGLLNADEDPAFAEMMLYSRNRNWAKWIEARMAQPGTVFVAVGAGHLGGGAKSVNDLLTRDGFRLTRVQ